MRKAAGCLAGMLIASLSSVTAIAASIDAGQALYTVNCLGCHGMPPNGMKIDNLVAANRPELIRSQIKTNPQMQFLGALSDAELADIATFLANPTTTDADCIFGWGETVMPTLLTPRTQSVKAGVIDYRYYPLANIYVGIAASPQDQRRHLYFLDGRAGAKLVDLGDLGSFLAPALSAECP